MSDLDARPPLPPPPPPAEVGDAAVRRFGRLSMTSTQWLSVGLLGAACGYTAAVDPSESSAYPQCPLRLLTGLDCAACGGLRATHALLNLDPARAADHNLLLVALLPLIAYALAVWVGDRVGIRLPRPRWRPWMTITLITVLLVFSVVRNLPWGPLPYLYSG